MKKQTAPSNSSLATLLLAATCSHSAKPFKASSPTSKPLHMLFPLPGILFPLTCSANSYLSFRYQLKGHFLRASLTPGLSSSPHSMQPQAPCVLSHSKLALGMVCLAVSSVRVDRLSRTPCLFPSPRWPRARFHSANTKLPPSTRRCSTVEIQ